MTFKNRAPRAIRVIKDFAAKAMKTSDNRIDTNLNKFIWSQGLHKIIISISPFYFWQNVIDFDQSFDFSPFFPAHLHLISSSTGVKNVPKRIRIRVARKRNDDEEAKEKLYSHISFVETGTLK